MPKAENLRIELNGALEGRHILVAPSALTIGLLEDLQSGEFGTIMDGLAAAIVGGDLPQGSDRKGLRALTVTEFHAVCGGVGEAYQAPKNA